MFLRYNYKKKGFHIGIINLRLMIWALGDQSIFRVQRDPFIWKIFIKILLWPPSPAWLKLPSDPVLQYQGKFTLTAIQNTGSVTPYILTVPSQAENWKTNELMGSMMFSSFKQDMILEPWLCRWVSFLTRTGPILVPLFKKSGPFLIPFRDLFLQGPEIATLYMIFFWMEFYQSYECSRWVDIVLHCLLHSASWFQGEGRRGFSGGCGEAPCAAILQKIRISNI